MNEIKEIKNHKKDTSIDSTELERDYTLDGKWMRHKREH